jgi:hypothetical protein
MAIRSRRIGYFVSKINTDGSFGKVQNVVWRPTLRMILDIGLTPNPEEAFSSNRAGGQGYDIYKFLETKKLFANKIIWKSDRFSHF